MKKKDWDLKSIITLIVVSVLSAGVMAFVVAVITQWIAPDNPFAKEMLDDFSKAVLMILTFYFARTSKNSSSDKKDGE